MSKKHWKEGHKFVCKGLPYKIGKSADLGRFLEAAKDLKKGEVLWKEPPLITGPIAVSPPVCLCCYTRVDGSYKYVHCLKNSFQNPFYEVIMNITCSLLMKFIFTLTMPYKSIFGAAHNIKLQKTFQIRKSPKIPGAGLTQSMINLQYYQMVFKMYLS